jgi:hypothetical protein
MVSTTCRCGTGPSSVVSRHYVRSTDCLA